MSQHAPELHRFVLREIPNLQGKTVLDVACGRGVWGFLLRDRSFPKDRENLMIGVDLDIRYLKFCNYHRIYDDIVLADVRRLPFRARSFDVIIASEIIEHLPKADGLKLLDELEKLARERIVVTTPNGFFEGGEGLERHVSGWHVNELKKKGFKVRGIGFRFMRIHKGIGTYLK